MTEKEVIARVAQLGRKNGMMCGFVTLTTPHMKKTSRATGLPFVGVVTCRKSFSAMLGVNYATAVDNQSERNGGERGYVPEKPRGKHYVGDSKWLMQSDTDEHKFYVAMDVVGGSKAEYFRDGQPMTEAEVADVKENFFDKPSASKIAGKWRTPAVESIVSIS